MLLRVLILVIISVACLTGIESTVKSKIKSKQNCDHLLHNVTQANGRFLGCVMNHYEIATFCLDCKADYTATYSYYEELLKSDDIENKNKSCRERFVDSNQLNVIDMIFLNAKKIWDHGFCSDCFMPDCDFTNRTQDCLHSNHTAAFTQLHNNTIKCIIDNEEHDKNVTCKNCETAYEKQNSYYNAIQRNTTDKFCFAIKDMMNKTRILWSKELQCCKDKQFANEDFYAMSSSSIVVSILFYIAIYLFGLRKERIQYIPDDLMPSRSEDQNQSNGTIMNINTEEPSTSDVTPEGIEPKIGKILNVSEDSSSDDDEILPVHNQNLIQI